MAKRNKKPGESNKQYAARRLRERHEGLKQPLLPPLEHHDMHWWCTVVRDAEQRVKAAENHANSGKTEDSDG